jgi:hypothetical protein
VDDGAVHRIHYRFGLVLILILATITFTLAAPSGDGARFVAVLLQGAVLVAAVLSSRARQSVTLFTAIAVLIGIVGAGLALFGSGGFGNDSAGVIALLYVGLTPVALVFGVIRQFRETETVTLQTMFGVLCLYLLIGLIFGVAYGTVGDLSDRSFFNPPGSYHRDDFLYFSYTTLSTVGYGDLVAATDLGRSLAITEALVGQLYLVTVVAVIISNLEAVRPGRRRKDKAA